MVIFRFKRLLLLLSSYLQYSSSSITINVKTTTTRTLYNSFSNYKPMDVNEIGDVSMAGTWGTASGRAVCPKGAAAHSAPLYSSNSRRRLYLESTTYYLIATLLHTETVKPWKVSKIGF